MLIVGLTGGVGSGKTEALHFFKALAVSVITADEIAREILDHNKTIQKKLLEHFGDNVLLEAPNVVVEVSSEIQVKPPNPAKINRKWLRERIFSNPADRVFLEQLLHPEIKQRIQAEIERLKKISLEYIIIEIPLLIESHSENLVDRILVIDCPEDLQIKRVQARDHLDINSIQNILKVQASRERRIAAANDIIENAARLEDLKNAVEKMDQYYKSIAR